MLILTRRIGEILNIGDDITLCVIAAEDHRVRLGICAPREMTIDRLEVRERRLHQQQRGRDAPATQHAVPDKGPP